MPLTYTAAATADKAIKRSLNLIRDTQPSIGRIERPQDGQVYQYYLQSVLLDTGEHPFLGGKTDIITLGAEEPRHERDFFSRFFDW